MNEISTIHKMPNGLTPLLSKSLDSQALAKHRATVGFELEVLSKKVDRFGWDRDRNTPAHDRLMIDWMDALQDYPLSEVQAACRAAVLSSPNKMPNEGHVKAQIIAARAKVVASQPKREEPEPPKERVSREVAADILSQAGYAPKTFGARDTPTPKEADRG